MKQHPPGPWFIWKERAMQDEGDLETQEISEELSEYESFEVMAGEPIGKVTRSSIRGCKTITEIDSINFGESEDEGRQIALANARVIAAAPELLEVLKSAVSVAEMRDGKEDGWVEQARAAIAKATNE